MLPATKSSLPFDVSDSRLPQWMLPTLPETIRLRLRPDILIVHGLTQHSFCHTFRIPLEQLDLVTLAAVQRSCTVHIIEVGYTSDASFHDSLSRKRAQHNLLVHYLQFAGWTVSSSSPFPPHPVLPDNPFVTPLADDDVPLPPQLPAALPDLSSHVHIFLISFTGVLYKPITPMLLFLGLHGHDVDNLLRSLHLHTVSFADTILKTRRRLESDPHTFSHHFRTNTRALPLPPHDPP